MLIISLLKMIILSHQKNDEEQISTAEKKQGSPVKKAARGILGGGESRQRGMESRKTVALGHDPRRKGDFSRSGLLVGQSLAQ